MSIATNYHCPICDTIVSSGHVCSMVSIRTRIDTLTAELAAARERVEFLDVELAAMQSEKTDLLNDVFCVTQDRDRLAACVERVGGVLAEEPILDRNDDGSESDRWVVLVEDIFAALEGTNEAR